MTASLSLNIVRQVGDFQLNVGFETSEGITTLFGPSGAGKTMVLDCLAGLETPDEGNIEINGVTVFDSASSLNLAPERRRIGYVFQHGRLFPHLTVEQNLIYGYRLLSESDRRIPYDDVIDVLGISDLLGRRTHRLSGGEQQRVAIGRALMMSPQLILMDEPLASLDPARRKEILPFIEHLRDAFNIPIVYVSHILDEVIRLGDMAVLIEDGGIVAHGPVDDILNRQDLQPILGLKSSTGDHTAPNTVLSVRISEHDLTFGLTRVTGHGLSLWVPRLERPIGTTLRLRIRSSDVAISLQEPENTSILNTFQGTIEMIEEPFPGFVHVAIGTSAGLNVWARITTRSAARLRLEVGHSVWGLLKSVAVITGAK